jgi:ribonucleoside-diphosphate reductase alpha chain
MDTLKLQRMLQRLASDLSPTLDTVAVAQEASDGACDGLRSDELGTLVAQLCAARAHYHPDYARLAGRIEAAQLHKVTPARFSEAVRKQSRCSVRGTRKPLVSSTYLDYVERNADALDAAIVTKRDFDFDFFGMRTLQRGYLLRDAENKSVERPQHMYMRVAVAIHGPEGTLADVIEAYEDMSLRRYSHASPTLFHAGAPVQQLSSCFLTGTFEDSVAGIYDTLKQCALISKTAGGIGLAVSHIRAKGSYIEGTQGHSNGIVPMLRVFNDTARYIDQGGGRRRGAVAVYIEPWHADIFDVLDMKRSQGAEELRARDLFYALWIPDAFMRAVETDGEWALMCPDACPGLDTVHGARFEALYQKYVDKGVFVRKVRARQLWSHILEVQMETGGPYMLYKDTCNRTSNHQHLGTIRSSNLCTEIVQFTSQDEVAVCNLGSLCLPSFMAGDTFDYEALHGAARRLARALDRVIDVNYYPVPEAERSNRTHRPVGIGVQGLADVFAERGLPYDSDEARAMNRRIFETIYHGALTESCARARTHGRYESYAGSPTSEGSLQMDLQGRTALSGHLDWDTLRADIDEHGLRNSLLTAPMPTASTAQIVGNTESFEPATSNLYVRRVLSGEFMVINPRLVRALEKASLWPRVRPALLRAGGSVQEIEEIPQNIRDTYKTVWEMRQRPLVDMAAERGPFIDQSQSLNVFMKDATADRLTALHFRVWRQGVKGTYYLHSRAPREAVQFTLIGDQSSESPGVCESCSA